MKKVLYILCFLLIGSFTTYAQVTESKSRMQIKGSVKGQEKRTAIAGVEVSTSGGEYTVTDSFGEFKILASVGQELVFEHPEIETVRYIIKSSEDVDVLVQGYVEKNVSSGRSKMLKREASLHKVYLDSANVYKKTDIEKSIDFITKSISELGKRGNNSELSKSLTLLGEVYLHYQQYDLAITKLPGCP